MTGGTGNLALVAVIAIVPLVALMLTSFVKISVVLSLLRNAIGAPDAPSGLVVMGLSLLLTIFVMAPVASDMARAAVEGAPDRQAPTPTHAPATPGVAPPATGRAPARSATGTSTPGAASTPRSGPTGAPAELPAIASPASPSPVSSPSPSEGRGPDRPPIDLDRAIRELVPVQYRGQVDAAARALVPLRGFLARHAGARDRATFAALAARMGRAVQGDELWVTAPAFVTTELREAFALAVLIFVPFLVIDLVVGLGLAALGLAATSPQAIALPLKLLLFVSVDGWRLLIDGLVRGYA